MPRLACFFLLLFACMAPVASAGDWSRYGGDAQVTNNVPNDVGHAVGIDAAHADALQQKWRRDLDGAIVASPLYLDGTEGYRATVYVATEAGSVYALRARDGTVIWQRTFPTYVSPDPDCGNYGVSSTGVIDRARGVIYIAAADGTLHALDLVTGADAAGWPVQLPVDTLTAYVWGGLTLVGSTLYVPVASFCDDPSPTTGLYPTGGITAIDVGKPAVSGAFAVSPPGTLGGIWGWGGASVDPLTGDLWVATGNSEPLGDGEAQGYAEAVVQLDPSLGVVASNRPGGIPDAALDTDFGSTPLLFQPDGCPPLAAAHNKNGELYVWNRQNLGGGPIWSKEIGPDDLATPFTGEPSWSPELQELIVANARVYDQAVPSGVAHFSAAVAFTIGAGCTFPDAPSWISDVGQGTKPPALIVGDVAFVSGGDASVFTELNAATGAVLRAFFLESNLYAGSILAGNEIVAGNVGGTVFALAPKLPPRPKGARQLHVRHIPSIFD
ncbi:MAG TPA: PQQ-binding-like beta-propeller repeat protein [Gaiellaceae bacterium]|nr:PQQ-binding-like beta-propeller repeat protein [Gaiellaceae bacterium]